MIKSSLLLLGILTQTAAAVRNIQIFSPLQSLTIWDEETKQVEASTARFRFLPKFRAGLEAETRARKSLADKRHEQLQVDATTADWSQKALTAADRSREAEELLLEKAFDRAVAPYEEKEASSMRKRKYSKGKSSNSGLQFVGVVNSSKGAGKPITWYSRKKPAHSNWSVRLVHVNRDAILKDLFDQGKIDIFARYEHTGRVAEDTGIPIIRSEYSVRQRSWKNIWNFSPKHFFSDSSGNYWRERRLRPGMYTDGQNVYEATYRYRDGRNGMSRRSTWQQFLNSKSIDPKAKERALKRLKAESPDVVLEE